MRYFQPETLKDLLMILDHEKDRKIIAGGTDLVIIMEATGLKPDSLIDITSVQSLSGINTDESGISIGSATNIATIASSDILPQCLVEGASSIGSPQIRNVATIGGNICNASPCGDTLAPLLCLNADFVVVSNQNKQTIAADKFFLAPKKTVLKENEVLSEIRISKHFAEGLSGFRMIGQRNGQAISQVNLAIWFKRNKVSGMIEEIRIAAGSVAPTPIRIIEAEKLLCDTIPGKDLLLKAAHLVQDSIKPIDDVRSSAEYRQDVIVGLFLDIMNQLLNY